MTSLFKAMQQLEQGLLRKQATLQEVMPGAQPMVMPPPDDPAQWVTVRFWLLSTGMQRTSGTCCRKGLRSDTW